MKLYDSFGPNPQVVRMFILERGGLTLEVEPINILNLENRNASFINKVNSRGEIPALESNGSVITEITAICEFLDEVAVSGNSLIGDSAEERAQTRMWTRRVYLEACQHFVNWWRNTPEGIDFYRGHRIPLPEQLNSDKYLANTGLNRLDSDLEGKRYLCGERFSMADVVLYGFMNSMSSSINWLNPEGRKNIFSWYDNISERESAKRCVMPFESGPLSIN